MSIFFKLTVARISVDSFLQHTSKTFPDVDLWKNLSLTDAGFGTGFRNVTGPKTRLFLYLLLRYSNDPYTMGWIFSWMQCLLITDSRSLFILMASGSIYWHTKQFGNGHSLRMGEVNLHLLWSRNILLYWIMRISINNKRWNSYWRMYKKTSDRPYNSARMHFRIYVHRFFS